MEPRKAVSHREFLIEPPPFDFPSIKNHVLRLHISGRGVWLLILPFALLCDPPVPARRESYAQIAGSIGPRGARRRSYRMYESQSLQSILASRLLSVWRGTAAPSRRGRMLRSLYVGAHDDVGPLLPVSGHEEQ